MNSKHKGISTELETMVAFAKRGYTILIPYGDNERYDYMVNIGHRLIRVQSKTARTLKDGESFIFDVRITRLKQGKSIHIPYEPESIDYFATIYKGKCYLFPVGLRLSAVKLHLSPPEGKPEYEGLQAKDYEFDVMIEHIIEEQND